MKTGMQVPFSKGTALLKREKVTDVIAPGPWEPSIHPVDAPCYSPTPDV